MKKSVVVAAAMAASVCAVSAVRAGDFPTDRAWDIAHSSAYQGDKYAVSFEPDYSKPLIADSGAAAKEGKSSSAPVVLLDGAPSTSKIHGFLDFRFATGYLTPRGLQVQNSGLVMQPLAGLVFDLYDGSGPINNVSFIAGIWSSIHTDHPNADIWNECDIFGGFSVKFLDKFTFDTTAMVWTFPDVSNKNESDPSSEYNLEFKLSYDDTEYLKEFAMHPYVSLFWNFGGDSPVVLGHRTFYCELGVAPSYTCKAISDLPITITFPMYVQAGDSSFWGASSDGTRSNIGLFSVGTKISVPLSFIPKDYGSWSAYVGVTYIHACNEALAEASAIVGSGESHERYLGYCGIGMGF